MRLNQNVPLFLRSPKRGLTVNNVVGKATKTGTLMGKRVKGLFFAG